MLEKNRRAMRGVGWLAGMAMTAVAVMPTPVRGQGPGPGNGPPLLEGATPAERAAFQDGLAAFTRSAGPLDGLGPVFNGVSCAECHRSGGIGGAAQGLGVAVVTRIGALHNGVYTDLPEVGGPLLQARSLREFNRNYPVAGEVVPKEAQFVSRRLTTSVWGSGLIEAIPDDAIVALERTSRPDGVKGVANRVKNPETGKTEIGRFGWKAQISSLHWFSGDAFLNEMGVTNRSFPTENLPQGKPIPPGADPVKDYEDTKGDVERFTSFMRFVAPFRPEPPTGGSVRGQAIFDQIRCTSCHVESLKTGANASRALSNVSVRLFSDLLLHRMGPGLNDGIHQGSADGEQWRTAPLWGLSHRPRLLHDGRATSVDQAIQLHGGEATASRDRYKALNAKDRSAVLEFLGGL